MMNRGRYRSERGFALLDVALALTVFALSVTSLVVLLDRIVTTSSDYAWERLLQSSMASYLAETKVKPVSAMTAEYYDESLEVTFRSVVEPLELSNVDGEALDDLYKLTVTAEYKYGRETRSEQTELLIYKPEAG